MEPDVKGKCRKHGIISPENGIVCKDKDAIGGLRLRCKICIHENKVNYYYRNQKEIIRKACEWKKENRERANISAKNCYHKDIEYTRDKEASRKKGLNLEQYHAMIKAQDGKCAICGLEESRKNRSGEISKRLSIDHNHETGAIRSLLCHDCNTGLGKFKDSIILLESTIKYLKHHESKED